MAMWVIVEDLFEEPYRNHYENQLLGIYETYDEAAEHLVDNVPKGYSSFSETSDSMNYHYEVGYKNGKMLSAFVNRHIERIEYNNPKEKLSGESIIGDTRLCASDFLTY